MLNFAADMLSRHLGMDAMARFYNRTPRTMLRWLNRDRFHETVMWAARHSLYYREAFQRHGIDPRQVYKPSDLGAFYTTPEDLASRPTDFICRPPSIVFESSGTSGRNKQVYYAEDELRDMGRMMAIGFRMMGITPQDRVANAFDFSIWIPGMVCHYGLMAAGNFSLAFGKVDPVEVYRRLETYGFTVVFGEPTWLIRLTELAEQHGAPRLKILLGSAEEMPAAAIPWMEHVWHGAKVKMNYGSVEQGSAIGFQPCDTDGYHLDDFDFLPELIEPDDEGYGELVITTLRRTVMPLIRYRTRDVTRLETERCACGSLAPRMARLRGRRDELIVASGGNLYPKMFEEILAEVPGLVGHDWQVVFRLEGIREVMEIHVETAEAGQEATHEAILREATQKYPDLIKNLNLGIFEMRTILHAPGSMRTARKLKRLVDLRYQPVPTVGEPVPARFNGNGANNHEANT